MKRSTAMTRLSDVCDGLDRASGWPETTVVAAYVVGDLLEPAPQLERVDLVFVVDEPAEDVCWMARPRHLEALADVLRFTKLPLSWHWRPAGWPVWNHTIRRAVRFWEKAAGRDELTLTALESGHLDGVRIDAAASDTDLLAQLRVERDVARRRLGTVTGQFYEAQWRREHRGEGAYPEDTLWQAAAGWIDLDEAIGRLGG